jgi:hypothetical protein
VPEKLSRPRPLAGLRLFPGLMLYLSIQLFCNSYTDRGLDTCGATPLTGYSRTVKP